MKSYQPTEFPRNRSLAKTRQANVVASASAPELIGSHFWLQWVVVTVIGFWVSLYWIEISERSYLGAVEGLVGGAVIGLAQWIALRRKLPRSWWWIGLNSLVWGLMGLSGLGALGWVAPQGTTPLAGRLIYGLVDGIKVGAAIGLSEWLLLRSRIAIAQEWILANIAAWAIGLALAWTVGGLIRQNTGLFLGEVLGLTVGWTLIAALTGAALVRLLRAQVVEPE